MTMDLWYDLAVRELPDLDGAALIEKLQGTDAMRLVEDEPEPAAPVDFY